MGHATMENRHGLAVAGMVTLATGTPERRASEIMLKAKAKEASRRITVGEDKAYDTANHVANLRAINVLRHVTQNDNITATGKRRQSAIDGRTTRHEGYAMSQSSRAMTECIFGLGQAARHDAQDQTSWHSQCRYRLHSQSDRLQPDPHPQTIGGLSWHPLPTPPEAPKLQSGKKQENALPSRFFSKLLEQIPSISRIARMPKVVAGFAGGEITREGSDLRRRRGIVRSAALRRYALSLLNGISIGFRSGEYGGR